MLYWYRESVGDSKRGRVSYSVCKHPSAAPLHSGIQSRMLFLSLLYTPGDGVLVTL